MGVLNYETGRIRHRGNGKVGRRGVSAVFEQDAGMVSKRQYRDGAGQFQRASCCAA